MNKKRMIASLIVSVGTLLSLSSFNIYADSQTDVMVHKCTHKNGGVSFQDVGCSADAKAEIIYISVKPCDPSSVAAMSAQVNRAMERRHELQMQARELESRVQVAKIISSANAKNSKDSSEITVYTAPTPYAATLEP